MRGLSGLIIVIVLIICILILVVIVGITVAAIIALIIPIIILVVVVVLSCWWLTACVKSSFEKIGNIVIRYCGWLWKFGWSRLCDLRWR